MYQFLVVIHYIMKFNIKYNFSLIKASVKSKLVLC